MIPCSKFHEYNIFNAQLFYGVTLRKKLVKMNKNLHSNPKVWSGLLQDYLIFAKFYSSPVNPVYPPPDFSYLKNLGGGG